MYLFSTLGVLTFFILERVVDKHQNKTQRQLCKRLAGPFIPFSWSCLVWKRVSLWMWSLGGSQQPFSCVLGHFRHGDEESNNWTTSQVILEQASSWPVWEGSLCKTRQYILATASLAMPEIIAPVLPLELQNYLDILFLLLIMPFQLKATLLDLLLCSYWHCTNVEEALYQYLKGRGL